MTAPYDNDLPPIRLLDAQATPHALRDALHALRERAPSAEAAARIEQQLGRPVQGTSRLARPLFALCVLGLLGGLVVWAWPEHEAIRAPSSGATTEAPALPLPAPSQARPAAPARELHAQPAPARAEAARQALAEPLVAPVAPLEKELAAAARPARTVKRSKPAAPMPAAAPIASPAVLDDETAEEIEAPAPTLTPPPDDTERLFADPQDEAGLLYRARRLASSEPKAALRLLVLHEASFPDGAFVQERDMLEIQIHEHLGHAATAKRLAALFKQRYPESVYRVSP